MNIIKIILECLEETIARAVVLEFSNTRTMQEFKDQLQKRYNKLLEEEGKGG